MFDLIVIGGGPGGYVSAIRAAQLGLKVALIEKDSLGGVCLNWGCIPTKSLLESAELYQKIKKSESMGINCSDVSVSMDKIVSRSRSVVKKLTSGVAHLLKKNDVTVYNGHAHIEKSGNIKIVKVNKETEVAGKNIIIATGASNRSLAGVVVDGKHIWDCRHAMMAHTVPKSLIIIGAGAIGLEFASFFNALGTKVTVVEYADKILSYADEDIIKWAEASFRKSGIDFVLSSAVDKAEVKGDQVVVSIKDKHIAAEKCLVAVGIIGNTSNLGLENVPSIKLERGQIVVNEACETGEHGIYAIGDVTNRVPWLAHKASQEGIRCAERIAGHNAEHVDPKRVPICVYSMPQVAQIGLTEAEAVKAGKDIIVGKYPLSANGKALTENNEGWVKVILEKRTKILVGAHIIGSHVTELIQGYGLMQSLEAVGEDIHHIIFAHPTLSEAVQEAVTAAMGIAIHY
jgi:dihydrolipoamide dehydrogenase